MIKCDSISRNERTPRLTVLPNKLQESVARAMGPIEAVSFLVFTLVRMASVQIFIPGI